jgi:hypothetical protein
MAKEKTVIDWGEPLEVVPQMTPGIPASRVIPIEAGETPSPETARMDLGEFAGQQLRKGFADIAQLLTLPFRIPGFETEKAATELSQRIPGMFGITEIGARQEPIQAIAGGGLRAVPTAVLPGPKGASFITKSPTAAGEAGLTAFGVGAGVEAGRIAGEGTAFEIPLMVGGGLAAGSATSTLFNLLTSVPGFAKQQVRNINSKIRDAVGEENFKKLVDSSTAQTLQRILVENPDLVQKLDRIEELREFIPGFNPNLFQATDATTVSIRGQAALQRRVESIPEVRQQTQKSMDAVRQKTADLFPVTESSFVFAGKQYDKTNRALAALVQNADNKIGELTTQFVKTGKQDLGQQIRAAYEGRKQAVYQIFQDQYTALDDAAAKANIGISPEQVGGIFSTVQANRELFESSPELFQLVSTKFAPKAPEAPTGLLGPTGQPLTPQVTTPQFDKVSFGDLRSLSRRLNSDYFSAAEAASRNVPDAGRKALVLGKLKEKVDQAIESLPADVKTKYKALNAAYDEQYREVFKKGLGGLIGAKTRMGERVKDEDIVGQLTKPSNVDDFYRIFGNTEETQIFLRNGLIEKFLSQPESLTSAGLLNQAALTKFVRTNEEIVKKIPSLQNFLNNAQTNIADFAAQKNAAVLGIQELQSSALANISKKQNLDQVLSTNATGAFQDLTKLSQLIGASKADPSGRALKGLQGTMMEKALEAKDPVEFLKKNEKAFQRAFGNDFETVKKLTEASQMLGREFQVSPPVRILEGDALQRATGSGVPQIFSLLKDRITSVSTKASILFSRFTQAKGLEAQDKAFLEVFKDPSLAKEALKNVNVLRSPVSPDEAKAKAMSGLNMVLTKAGVNIYRVGAITGIGEAGRSAEEEQQRQAQGEPRVVEIPEMEMQ